MNENSAGDEQLGRDEANQIDAKDTPEKQKTKSRTRNREERSNPQTHNPELLSKLALQILELDPKGISNQQQPGLPIAEPTLDWRFLHALKQADLLLRAAAGESDEDIHAYQVFVKGEKLLTFQEIADRFKEAGWSTLTSRNSVEICIDELVSCADYAISNHIGFFERRQSLELRRPTSIYDLKSRLGRHIRSMLFRTSLSKILRDPGRLSDQVAQFLIARIERELPIDDPCPPLEEREAYDGYSSFDDFVLDPPSFQAFLGGQSRPRLTPELFQGIIYFFRNSATRKRDISVPSHKLMELHRTLDLSGVIHESLDNNLSQLIELVAANDGSSRSKQKQWKLSDRIATDLERLQIPWLRQEMLVHHANNLNDDLVRLRSPYFTNGPDESPVPVGDIEHLISVIKAPSSGTKGSQDKKLAAILTAVNQALEACQSSHAGLQEKLSALKNDLEHPPHPPSLSPKNLRLTIGDFFRQTTPPRVDRKIRPYEIFLFAAQQELLPDKLVRRRRALNSDFVPNPPHRSYLSVLAYHRGNPMNGRENAEGTHSSQSRPGS